MSSPLPAKLVVEVRPITSADFLERKPDFSSKLMGPIEGTASSVHPLQASALGMELLTQREMFAPVVRAILGIMADWLERWITDVQFIAALERFEIK